MGLMNHDGLNNLDRGLQKKHSCNVILKLVQWFLTRRFLNFLYRYIGKISPAPWWPCFLMNHDGLNNLGRGLQKKLSCRVILKSGQEDFKVFYIDISPAPWWPCFLTNPNGLNNLSRGSPKEHFCKIILKLVQWFLTRRFFKFLV